LDLSWRKWEEAGEDYIMRNFFKLYAFLNLIRGDRIKDDDIGGYVRRMEEMRNA
jgi:hypothetical protein